MYLTPLYTRIMSLLNSVAKLDIHSEIDRSTWLVTGGAGFLGLHMCRLLLQKKQTVISYDTQSIPSSENLSQVEQVIGDIRDQKKLASALKGVRYVVHCAAALALEKPEEIDSVNAEGTRIVLEEAAKAGAKRFVYIGTTAVYGMPKFHPIYEDAPLNPMGHYGIAKAKAEKYCLTANGIESVLIRPKSFIGTGRLGIFQILCDWIESGKRIYLFGDGNNRFQLLEVRDLCSAIFLAMLNGHPGQIYNIGSKHFGTVNEDIEALLSEAGTGSKAVHLPAKPLKKILRFLEFLKISPIYRWVYDTADQDSFISIEKAEKELGWSPKYSNKEALISTYNWYLTEGKIMAQQTGTSHRVAWKQGVLKVVKAFS